LTKGDLFDQKEVDLIQNELVPQFLMN